MAIFGNFRDKFKENVLFLMQTASYIQEEKLSKFRKFSALEGPVSNEPVSYIKSVSSGDNMLGNLKPFWFTFWRGQRSVSTISSNYDDCYEVANGAFQKFCGYKLSRTPKKFAKSRKFIPIK